MANEALGSGSPSLKIKNNPGGDCYQHPGRGDNPQGILDEKCDFSIQVASVISIQF